MIFNPFWYHSANMGFGRCTKLQQTRMALSSIFKVGASQITVMLCRTFAKFGTYMVTKQTVTKKHGFFWFCDTIFERLRLKKEKNQVNFSKIKAVWYFLTRICFSDFTINISLHFVQFFLLKLLMEDGEERCLMHHALDKET